MLLFQSGACRIRMNCRKNVIPQQKFGDFAETHSSTHHGYSKFPTLFSLTNRHLDRSTALSKFDITPDLATFSKNSNWICFPVRYGQWFLFKSHIICGNRTFEWEDLVYRVSCQSGISTSGVAILRYRVTIVCWLNLEKRWDEGLQSWIGFPTCFVLKWGACTNWKEICPIHHEALVRVYCQFIGSNVAVECLFLWKRKCKLCRLCRATI